MHLLLRSCKPPQFTLRPQVHSAQLLPSYQGCSRYEDRADSMAQGFWRLIFIYPQLSVS